MVLVMMDGESQFWMTDEEKERFAQCQITLALKVNWFTLQEAYIPAWPAY